MKEKPLVVFKSQLLLSLFLAAEHNFYLIQGIIDYKISYTWGPIEQNVSNTGGQLLIKMIH